jgi:hypothetical protein
MAKRKSSTPRTTKPRNQPKLKHTKRRQPKAPPHKPETSTSPDAALIRLCITITVELAAFHGGWDTDPDPNNVHVEPIAYAYSNRAKRAVEKGPIWKPRPGRGC